MSSLVHHYTIQLILVDAPPPPVSRVVDTLTTAGFPPTHWGPTRGVRRRFDAAELGEFAAKSVGTGDLPYLLRTARPRYECALFLFGRRPHQVRLESQLELEPEEHAAYFAMGLALAQALHPVFGGVEPNYRTPPQPAKGDPDHSMIYAPKWSATGPHRVFARTFFGSPLLEALREGGWLERAGLTTTLEQPDLVCLDAVHEPWSASADAYWQGVRRATRALLDSALFAQTDERLRFVPGPRWTPAMSGL